MANQKASDPGFKSRCRLSETPLKQIESTTISKLLAIQYDVKYGACISKHRRQFWNENKHLLEKK